MHFREKKAVQRLVKKNSVIIIAPSLRLYFLPYYMFLMIRDHLLKQHFCSYFRIDKKRAEKSFEKGRIVDILKNCLKFFSKHLSSKKFVKIRCFTIFIPQNCNTYSRTSLYKFSPKCFLSTALLLIFKRAREKPLNNKFFLINASQKDEIFTC